MNDKQESESQPPSAPEIERKFRLHRHQYITIPLLFLVPLLALLGVFGETYADVQETSADFTLEVTYATRFRYQMLNTMTIAVTNNTPATIDSLLIGVSTEYIEQFSEVSFSPSLTRATDIFYEVELKNIPSSETQNVSVELQGERYGQHSGVVKAEADGFEPVSVHVSTLIFP